MFSSLLPFLSFNGKKGYATGLKCWALAAFIFNAELHSKARLFLFWISSFVSGAKISFPVKPVHRHLQSWSWILTSSFFEYHLAVLIPVYILNFCSTTRIIIPFLVLGSIQGLSSPFLYTKIRFWGQARSDLYFGLLL